MPRRTPNREVLRAESSHLAYEIEMLCALADYFETGEVNRAVAGLRLHGIPVRNAVIESFALHVRQLIDFLSPPPPGPRTTTSSPRTTTLAGRSTRPTGSPRRCASTSTSRASR